MAFPDLGALDIRKNKASEMGFQVAVSNFPEHNATYEQKSQLGHR